MSWAVRKGKRAAAAAMFASAAAAIQIGDPRDAVLAELGPPRGYIRMDHGELLYFARGTVRLRRGCVEEFELLTPEEARARQRAEVQAAAPRSGARRAAAESALIAAELTALTGSVEFHLLSPEEQIDRLAAFAAERPGAPIAPFIATARRRMEERDRIQQQSRDATALLAAYAEAAQRREREPIFPSYFVHGGTTMYYVRPWTIGFGGMPMTCQWGPPDCLRSSRPAPPSTWPYDFGTGGSRLRIGARTPSMAW